MIRSKTQWRDSPSLKACADGFAPSELLVTLLRSGQYEVGGAKDGENGSERARTARPWAPPGAWIAGCGGRNGKIGEIIEISSPVALSRASPGVGDPLSEVLRASGSAPTAPRGEPPKAAPCPTANPLLPARYPPRRRSPLVSPFGEGSVPLDGPSPLQCSVRQGHAVGLRLAGSRTAPRVPKIARPSAGEGAPDYRDSQARRGSCRLAWLAAPPYFAFWACAKGRRAQAQSGLSLTSLVQLAYC